MWGPTAAIEGIQRWPKSGTGSRRQSKQKAANRTQHHCCKELGKPQHTMLAAFKTHAPCGKQPTRRHLVPHPAIKQARGRTPLSNQATASTPSTSARGKRAAASTPSTNACVSYERGVSLGLGTTPAGPTNRSP